MMYFQTTDRSLSAICLAYWDGLFPQTPTRTQLGSHPNWRSQRVSPAPQILELELVKDDASPRRCWGCLEFGSRGGREDVQQCLEYDCSGGGVRFQFLWAGLNTWTIYYCTSRDVSLKVHVHIVVNIQLWKTSCTNPFHISICGTFKRCVDLTISWVTIMSKKWSKLCAPMGKPFKKRYSPCECWCLLSNSLPVLGSDTPSLQYY